MLKTARRAGVRAVAPTSSAKDQDTLVFKIIRCDSWPAHFRAPMCEVRSAKCEVRLAYTFGVNGTVYVQQFYSCQF